MNRRSAPAAVSALALAHHGWSEYHSTKPPKLSGTVIACGRLLADT